MQVSMIIHYFCPFVTRVGWIKSDIVITHSAVLSWLLHADRVTGMAKLIGTLLQILVAEVSKMDMIIFIELYGLHDSVISVSKEIAVS
jgi:hypothetical protein